MNRLLELDSESRRICSHLDQVETTEAVDPVCASCQLEGTRWVRVRMCLVCGETGCCDSSARRHARAHFEATGHPLIRSVEPGDQWAWCYLDRTYLTSS